MGHYTTILSIINETLDNQGITTTLFSKDMGVSIQKMLDFRNQDIKDTTLLFDCYDFLYPDKSTQDLLFLKEEIKNLPLKQLKNIYKHKDDLRKMVKHIKDYQYTGFVDDMLREIVSKTSRNYLRESKKNENYPLL